MMGADGGPTILGLQTPSQGRAGMLETRDHCDVELIADGVVQEGF
jgi:hypothetical protein